MRRFSAKSGIEAVCLILCSLLLLVAGGCTQDRSLPSSTDYRPQSGDLLFQDLDGSPLCDAIETVTEGYHGCRLSHVGMLVVGDDGVPNVIEAGGKGVVLTPMGQFLNRSHDPAGRPKVIVGRLKEPYRPLIAQAVRFALAQRGKPYDRVFVLREDAYYCSELLYFAFRNANAGREVFQPHPMTFIDPATGAFFPTWVEYYAKLGVPIPQGLPGLNPGGMSREQCVQIVHSFGHPDQQSSRDVRPTGDEVRSPAPAQMRQEPMSDASITPNDFEGSDVERINLAIEAAAATPGKRVVIPRLNVVNGVTRDYWLIDSAIRLRGNTTLELDNCRIKLSDRCRDNFMRSANCGIGIGEISPLRNIHIRGIGQATLEGADHPRATGDSAKTLGRETYGTDAGVHGEAQTGDWRNVGILLAFVEDFSIQNIAIKDSHCWAISLERCAQGTLRDIRFASTGSRTIDGVRRNILNQDGIDLRQGCHDILVENISGYTGDDLIALTAIPHGSDGPAGRLNATMVTSLAMRPNHEDDIRQITIRNIHGDSRGGHHIVRLLNTSGLRMYDIAIDALVDTSPSRGACRAAVKIGDSNPKWDGVTPPGDTRRVTINNVTTQAQAAILVAGSLCDSAISNIIQRHPAGKAIDVSSGPQYLRNVSRSNVVGGTP